MKHFFTLFLLVINCNLLSAQCEIQVDLISIENNDAGTPGTSDDFYIVTISIEGINTSPDGWVTEDGGFPDGVGLYGGLYEFGPYFCTEGDRTLIITDQLNIDCEGFVEINSLIPNIEITQNESLCQEEGGVLLRATGADPGGVYTWSNGSFGATTFITHPGQYSVSVSDTNYSSVLSFSENPLPIEIENSESVPVSFQNNNGLFSFTEGLSPIPDEFTVRFPDACANAGNIVCLPVQMYNFNNIIGMQFSVNYDASFLTYIGPRNFTQELLGFNIGSIGNPNSGNLTFTWNDPLAQGVIINDGTAIVELCFQIHSNIEAGSSTMVNFSGLPTSIAITEAPEVDVPFNSITGEVTINENFEDDENNLAFNLANVCGELGVATCVPLTVNSFDDITRFQFSINFDSYEMNYTGAQRFTNDLPNFTTENIGHPDSGNLTFSWTAEEETSVSLENGSALVELCFEPVVNNNCHLFGEIDVILEDCNILEGYVLRSANCMADGSEFPLSNWLIEIQGDNFLAYRQSDDNGYYSIHLPAGEFSVRLIPYSEVWFSCIELQTITFESTNEVREQNLFANAYNDCPLLEVSIHIDANLRRCWDDRPLQVQYENVGTSVLYNGLIAIVLPEELTYTSNALGDFIGQSADTVFFAAQSPLLPGESSMFIAYTSVDCDAVSGSSLCVRALGLPYGPCPSANELWTGATLLADGECTEDEVVFSVRNIGENPMSENGSYIVIQDGVMLLQAPGSFPPLGSGEETMISFPANGSTYRFEVMQEPAHPGFSQPIAIVEGCGVNDEGSFSMGFVQQLFLDDEDYYVDEDCRVVTNSYDPNDKQAEPLGFGEPHYIEPDQTLEYAIRFQNTGTDTAFIVVVRDTLSEWLDMRTLRASVSSHPYELQLDSARAISFIFDNILLPDSTTNLEGSQGFIEFKIDPIINAPLKTLVENTAAIYFDFNDPIITNTTHHTLGRNFIEIINWVRTTEVGQWQVFPNPAHEHIRVIQTEREAGTTFVLLDALGRRQKEMSIVPGETSIDITQLPVGWYTFQVLSLEGQLLGAGKLVKK